MKKIIFLSLLLLTMGFQNSHAEGWNTYSKNNIKSACIKKAYQNPPASITSKDLGCGCFVDTISKQLSFEDLRKRGDHSKYIDYVIEDTNKKCSSNYQF